MSLLDLAPARQGKPAKPFSAQVKALALADGSATVTDSASGVALLLERITAKLSDASTDAARPLAFVISAGVKSGGRVVMRGRAVPDAGTLDAKVEATGLSLAPLQPFVAARYSGVRLASGEASLAGTLRAGGKDAKLAYSGAASAVNVVLDDATGVRVLGWKALATESLRLTLSPDRLDVDEVRWIAPSGKFAIATDGSRTCSALCEEDELPDAPAVRAKERGCGGTSRRGRFAVAGGACGSSRARAIFSTTAERALCAKIYALRGTAKTACPATQHARQFEFEGRVDEFGYAASRERSRIRAARSARFTGELPNIDLGRCSLLGAM